MSHIEALIAEYYRWKGYFVVNNQRVGRLPSGGWEGELDIVAFDPRTSHLIHLEPSTSTNPWPDRETQFAKKFRTGSRYIHNEVFDWLDPATPIEQVAILGSRPREREELAGAQLFSIDQFVGMIRSDVQRQGVVSKNAISEHYPLLRLLQLSHNGFRKAIFPKGASAPS